MASKVTAGLREANPGVIDDAFSAPARGLDAAASLRDLSAIGGNRLEALKGDRAGQYSIRINDQWRICFEWPAGSPGPVNVEITDYH
jgi:plasmid maintenance system killer protein